MTGDNGKPGDRPLPDGSGNYNPDGTLRDLDAENPSQAEKMKLNYPEDMTSDDAQAEDDAADSGDGSHAPGGGHDVRGGDGHHDHEDLQPTHGNDGDHGHSGGSPGKSGDAPGHNK